MPARRTTAGPLHPPRAAPLGRGHARTYTLTVRWPRCPLQVVLGVGVAAVAGWVVQSLVLPRCRAWVDAWQASRREAEEQRNKVGMDGGGKRGGGWGGVDGRGVHVKREETGRGGAGSGGMCGCRGVRCVRGGVVRQVEGAGASGEGVYEAVPGQRDRVGQIGQRWSWQGPESVRTECPEMCLLIEGERLRTRYVNLGVRSQACR